jgi:VWFA-related protein
MILSVALAVLFAPSTPPRIVVRVGSDLVQVDATVTDGHGRQVLGLEAADFEISMDGKLQKVTHCQYVAVEGQARGDSTADEVVEAPSSPSRVIALVVDDYGLQFESTGDVRVAIRKFVDEHADGSVAMAVVRTHAPGMPQEFTRDPRALRAAVEALSAPPAEGMWPSRGRQVHAVRHRELMRQTFGALESVVDALATVPGRRAVAVFTDRFSVENRDPGFDRTADPEYSQSLFRIQELANRASVVVYMIEARVPSSLETFPLPSRRGGHLQPAPPLAPAMDGFSALHTLPEATGGRHLKGNDISRSLEQVVTDQSGYYLLAFATPDHFFERDKGKPRFHKIKLELKKRGLEVRSRRGFLGLPDELPLR